MPIQFAAVMAGIDAVVTVAAKMAQFFRSKSTQGRSQSANDPSQVIRDLQDRIATLESNEADQYKLIQDLAEPVRTLTNDTRVVARRTSLALTLSVLGAVLGALALILVLVT